ncbi:hypothetical protein HHI36_015565 [Cryptolaemus montrouzieri]|uniref:Uncharacterized protein n=1 Tax=Cryptolaemus montrouzieri TaxID=559131 RepID=A0ABD2N7F6_9CUCU
MYIYIRWIHFRIRNTKMKFALVVLVFIGCQAVENDEWAKFQEKFSKTYQSPLEMRTRMTIFNENLKKIEAHNALYDQGLVSWKMGVNHFSDWTEAEFHDYTHRFQFPDVDIDAVGRFKASTVSDAPDSIDWRDYGIVTGVKDQGDCGCCWSFSTIGAVESLAAQTNKRLVSFSEQNLVDCSIFGNYTNYGCRGGLMANAFNYVRDKGIETEDEYPYEGVQGECRQKRIVFQIGGHIAVDDNEEALRQAVAIRPVTVAICTTDKFQNYKSGIFYDDTCVSRINHAVVVVGYGSEKGQDFWIIKNSFGPDWGEEGYIRFARNTDNNCGLTIYANYPIL